jgi:hypothetical protein
VFDFGEKICGEVAAKKLSAVKFFAVKKHSA